MRLRIAIIATSLGSVLLAEASNLGRWIALIAGCTVLTWLVLVCVGRKPLYIFLPALYAIVFVAAFGAAGSWPVSGILTAALALAGLAAGAGLLARSVIAAEDTA